MLPKITKTDAKWLVEEYAPKKGYRIDHSTIPMFLKAYNILKGTNREVNCASCEGKALALMAKSLYEQHEAEVKKIANGSRKKKQK